MEYKRNSLLYNKAINSFSTKGVLLFVLKLMFLKNSQLTQYNQIGRV